jgi:hypothetical protein
MGSEIIVQALAAGAVAIAKKFAPPAVRELYYALKNVVLVATGYDPVVEEALPTKESDLEAEEATTSQINLKKKLSMKPAQQLEDAVAKANQLLDAIGQMPQADVVLKAARISVGKTGTISIDNAGSSVQAVLDDAKIEGTIGVKTTRIP